MQVLIVDDIKVYRHALSAALRPDARIDTVEVAIDVDAALHWLRRGTGSWVVLLNMAMTGSKGALRTLARAAPGVPVIAMAASAADEEIIACAEAGVAGYLHRTDSLDDLVALIESVARGETRCSPRVAATLLRRVAVLAGECQRSTLPADLTPREREVLHLLDDGLSNKQIARRLSIELRTVKNHVHHILEKCRVDHRHEAAACLRASIPGRHTANDDRRRCQPNHPNAGA